MLVFSFKVCCFPPLTCEGVDSQTWADLTDGGLQLPIFMIALCFPRQGNGIIYSAISKLFHYKIRTDSAYVVECGDLGVFLHAVQLSLQ